MFKSALLLSAVLTVARAKPNIIFALLDDAGWYDFQSHDPTMATPNIAELRKDGLFFSQSYVNPSCAPTRSALLTGRFSHTFGAQNGKALGGNKLFWVNQTFSFISNEMKELGYRTHALGKWHQGLCHPGLTPLGRGFDTFYGMLLGGHASYSNHVKSLRKPSYDWWNNDQVDWAANGTYSTELLSDRMVKIIEESDPNEPFYTYLAYPAPHGPFEVPQRYRDEYCPNVENKERQIHCGMVAAVDEGIGKIVDALKTKGIYDNTAIVVMSDNGGPYGPHSSNYPLRGCKKALYEGGTRTYTVFKAPGLKETGTTWPGMIHVVDWMPTLIGMAGGEKKSWMHGMDLWKPIQQLEDSPRTEFLYTYDDHPLYNHWGYRYGNWKLIKGKPGKNLGWYPPPNLVDSGEAKIKEVKKKDSYEGYYELYNVKKDPRERKNKAHKKTEIVEKIKELMDDFLKKYPPQPFKESADNEDWLDADEGIVNTCSCHPKGMPDCSE